MRGFRPEILGLYLVTDRSLSSGRDLCDVVSAAVYGGVTCVQLREKNIGTGDFIALGLALEEVLRPLGVPLIINDRVDVALAVNAEGVHIGQSDMPWEMAREILGPDRIIGLSAENMEQVIRADSAGVDYIGVSPVFSTQTKTDTAAPFGLCGLKRAAELSRHPVVAIGGINLSNARDVFAAGADGIAVVSAIMSAVDPGAAALKLKEEYEISKSLDHSRK